jgi:hypothetical protein
VIAFARTARLEVARRHSTWGLGRDEPAVEPKQSQAGSMDRRRSPVHGGSVVARRCATDGGRASVDRRM